MHIIFSRNLSAHDLVVRIISRDYTFLCCLMIWFLKESSQLRAGCVYSFWPCLTMSCCCLSPDSTPGGLSTQSAASRGTSVTSDLESGDDRVVVEYSSSVHKTSHIHNNSVTVTETSITDGGRVKTITTTSTLPASDGEASSQPEGSETVSAPWVSSVELYQDSVPF
jgi:hypothetical protein